MAYLITIPKEHKQEITQILRTTASLKDAKLDLLSCGTLGDDVDLLIDTDLDGWDVDGILEAHLDGAGYSFATKSHYYIGEVGRELAIEATARANATNSLNAKMAALARSALNQGSPIQVPSSFFKGGKAK
ncbi:hypothetical protein [Sphingobium chungangianum]